MDLNHILGLLILSFFIFSKKIIWQGGEIYDMLPAQSQEG